MATKVRIDTDALIKAINPDKNILPTLRERIERTFIASKQQLFNSLESDPITQELALGSSNSGIEANVSKVLNGYGTLFTFIGFERGTDPVKDLLRFLDEKVQLIRSPIKRSGKTISYKFIITRPSIKDYISELPLPWASGKSWVLSIENGISNFGYYMFLRRNNPLPNPPSRSGFGLQMKTAVNLTTFSPRKYISLYLEQFEQNVRSLESGRYGVRDFATGRFVRG